MASSTMSLIGLYNYYPDLFKFLTVPEQIDKETLIDTILLRSGEFEVLYPDPEFLELSIGAWSRKWTPTFNRWVNALSIKYDPLENYDRNEEWEDTNTGTQTTTNTGTQTSVGSGYEDSVRTGSEKDEADNGSTTENQVSAYDSSTYTPKDKTIFDTDQTNTHTYTDVKDTHTLHDLTSTRTDDLSAERTDDLTAHHEGRVHGNIGVTTSQQMLTSELDLGYWNIYEKITDLFLTEFVLPIY